MKKMSKFLVHHVKYNRDVEYEKKVEMKVEELKCIIDNEMSEKDKEYFVYHNPALKMKVGEKVHPSSRVEQLLKDKKFYIELV